MTRARAGAALLLLALILLAPLHPAVHAQSGNDGWLLAAVRVDGQFDLQAMRADGGPWQALTTTPDDERWPAWSPDSSQVAYAARRNRNWDLYLLDLRSGEETRLTEDTHFDGYPAWSPDGERIAFSSMDDGDLDILLLDLESETVRNLTADSPDLDFSPRWVDDEHLVYVSTAERSHDLYRVAVDVDGAEPEPLTQTLRVDERTPQPLPSGDLLVQSVNLNVRQLQRLEADGDPVGEPFSWTQSAVSVAPSPSGEEMVWVERRWEGDSLYRVTMEDDGIAQRLFGPRGRVEDLSWGTPPAQIFDARLRPPAPPARNEYRAQSQEFVNVEHLEAPDPALSSAVLESYERLRARVEAETGIDFLAVVSETVRPVDYATDESDYLSWHKAGRALDTLLYISSPDGGVNRGYVLVRDDWRNDVYWRILIRCPAQDGSCGQPLTDAPWEYEAAEDASEEGAGGARGWFVSGYYVDFTLLAWDENWERISSYQVPDFDWRETLYAMEYWHYQRTDGLEWYDAMAEVHDQETLELNFGWDTLQERDIAPWILRAKGVPLPPEIHYTPLQWIVP